MAYVLLLIRTTAAMAQPGRITERTHTETDSTVCMTTHLSARRSTVAPSSVSDSPLFPQRAGQCVVMRVPMRQTGIFVVVFQFH